MKVIYSDEPALIAPIPNSIFLAGPTPRSADVPSWRPKALELLKDFDGIVCVPERKIWENFDYVDQVEWEFSCLHHVSAIMFWVPRNMENMIGLTTNTEFGYWISETLSSHNYGNYGWKSRVVYGRPDNAPNTRYLDWLYEKRLGKQPQNTLEKTIEETINEL